MTADSPDLAAVLRESPEAYADTAAGERVLPVAALAAYRAGPLAAWLADFTRLALTVCLRLLELGVALEAHGQNLLVVLSPTGAPLPPGLPRPRRHPGQPGPARPARRAGPAAVRAGSSRTTRPTLRRKLFGSLVTGTLGATAGSAGGLRRGASPRPPSLPPTADTEALLTGPLPTKALTLMRLSPGVPGDQWAELPNPLTGG